MNKKKSCRQCGDCIHYWACSAWNVGSLLNTDATNCVNFEAPKMPESIETNIYNKEEIYPNCTVQVLTNTVTGAVSVGWWKNE